MKIKNNLNIMKKISEKHLKPYKKNAILPEESGVISKIYIFFPLVTKRKRKGIIIVIKNTYLISPKRWLQWLHRCFTTIFGGYKGGYKGGYRWVTHPKPNNSAPKEFQPQVYIPP